MNNFTSGGKAIKIRQPDTGKVVTVGWLDGTTFRWVVEDRTQRLRKWPAFAKDATVYEKLIRRVCTQLQVLDKVDDVVYAISVAAFEEHKWLLATKAGDQYACDRKHWTEIKG